MNDNLLKIINQFAIDGEPISCEPYGNGLINRTYLLKTKKKEYILQKINSYAFKDVDLLMNNINMVTSYLTSINVETMHIIKTNDGGLYYKEDNNSYYRIYDFVMNSVCYETVTNDELLIKDGKAFGLFHKYLNGLDATKLGEVIVNFHNTPVRYQNFEKALKANIKDRAKDCEKEIATILKYKDELSKIMDGMKDGSIRYTITHNDPKINNLLFDAKSDNVRCVIDLDTIMPGSVLFDIGDTFRSLFTGKSEDNPDLSLFKVNFNIFKKYLTGYLGEMKGTMTEKEIDLIPYSAFLMTIECGIRFLTDYLEGDVYFHTTYAEQNLARTRTQLALAEDIYNNFDNLKGVIKEII